MAPRIQGVMGRDISVQGGDGRVGSGEEGEEGLVRGRRQEGDRVGAGAEEKEKAELSEPELRRLPGEFVHRVTIFVPWPAFTPSEGMSVLSIVVRDTSTLRVSPGRENQLYQEIGDVLILVLIFILILILILIPNNIIPLFNLLYSVSTRRGWRKKKTGFPPSPSPSPACTEREGGEEEEESLSSPGVGGKRGGGGGATQNDSRGRGW